MCASDRRAGSIVGVVMAAATLSAYPHHLGWGSALPIPEEWLTASVSKRARELLSARYRKVLPSWVPPWTGGIGVPHYDEVIRLG